MFGGKGNGGVKSQTRRLNEYSAVTYGSPRRLNRQLEYGDVRANTII